VKVLLEELAAFEEVLEFDELLDLLELLVDTVEVDELLRLY